jgi:tRNA (guanine26-N2/guanine27-N2)-dimethyltransferase
MDDCVMTGPFYSKQLHDKSIVSLLKSRVERYQYEMASTDRFNSTSDGTPLIPIPTIKRMIGLLTAISEELHDVILYYSVPEMAKAIRSPKPKFLDIQSALYNSGYKASKFHHDRESIKTDAPSELVRIDF